MSSPVKIATAKAMDKAINPPTARSPKVKDTGSGANKTKKTKSIAGNTTTKSLASNLKNKAVKGRGKNKIEIKKPKSSKSANSVETETFKADNDNPVDTGDMTTMTTTKTTPSSNEAPSLVPAPEPSNPKVKGTCKIRYNHYTEEMDIEQSKGEKDGELLAANIVEALALDYAFPGNFVTHLNKSQQNFRSDRLWFQPETGKITGLEIGKQVREYESCEAMSRSIKSDFHF